MTTPHPQPTIDQWITHLRALAHPVLEPVPFSAGPADRARYAHEFRDEFGARNSSALALIARALDVPALPDPDTRDLDARLWAALAAHAAPPLPDIPANRGLADPDHYAIEHRTHIELCALHALTHLTPIESLEPLIEWNIAELQPDNGINRPWAIHAFIHHAHAAPDPDTASAATLHAQTLAHNCCVTLGRPDIVSAFILRDAADWLESRPR